MESEALECIYLSERILGRGCGCCCCSEFELQRMMGLFEDLLVFSAEIG